MYSLNLKPGTYKYAKHHSTFGLDLDAWLFDFLDALSLDPTRPCINEQECGFYNLFIKSGIYVKAVNTTKTMFDLEKYIAKALIFYGLITTGDYTAYCCKTRKRLHIYNQYLYFERGSIKKRKESLLLWLKTKLAEYDIDIEDTCC